MRENILEFRLSWVENIISRITRLKSLESQVCPTSFGFSSMHACLDTRMTCMHGLHVGWRQYITRRRFLLVIFVTTSKIFSASIHLKRPGCDGLILSKWFPRHQECTPSIAIVIQMSTASRISRGTASLSLANTEALSKRM